MKNIQLFAVALAAFALFSLNSNAQPKEHNNWHERMMSEKIAFITSELDLSPEEAQVFWPVYNANWKKSEAARKEINKSLKELNDALKQEPAVSDYDIKSLMNKYFKACEEEIKVNAESFEELSKVLPVNKAAKVFSLEEKFRIMLIRHLRR